MASSASTSAALFSPNSRVRSDLLDRLLRAVQLVAGDHVVVGLPGLADALVLGGLLLIVGAAVARDQAPGTVPDIDPGPPARRGPGVVHAHVARGRIVPAIVEFDSGPAVVRSDVVAAGVPLVAVIPQAADAAPGVAGEN